MSDHYTLNDFKGYSNPAIWAKIGSFLHNLAGISGDFRCIFSCISVIVNIFHLLILTRKSMRNNCINVLLMAIAIGDFFPYQYKCVRWNPNSYTLQLIGAWFIAIDDVLRRQCAYLGILMALIRYLVIKFSLNPRFQQLSKTIFGIKTVTITLILSTFVSSVYFSHFVLEKFDGWTPTDQCRDQYPVNYTEKLYLGHADLNFILSPYINADNWMLFSGGLKMVPTILLPVLTVLLVAELQKAKANRSKISGSQGAHDQPDHTTKMVTLMTVTSMISDGSIGIAYILQGFFSTSNGFLLISFDLITMFSSFVALNASMHCLICLVVSSQYRKAVKELFGWNFSNYTIIFIDAWLDFIDDFLRRQSAYLGILMAAIRVLVIKYTLNPRIQKLTNSFFALKSILAILTISILISSIYYSHYTMFHIDDWSPLPRCLGYSDNYTEKVYTIIFQDSFISDPFINDRNFMTMDGAIKIIPAGVLPILTILLVIEYRRAKINRQKAAGKDDSKPDHTTRMVTLMTISSMIAEGSVGISYILRGVAGEQWGFVRISLNLIQICYVFVAINASMHCIICLVVSTPYQNAVKEMCYKKKNVVISGNNPGKGSVSSVASVSQVVLSKPDHTTKMVMFMTVASMIAEGPLGLALVLQGAAGFRLTEEPFVFCAPWGGARSSVELKMQKWGSQKAQCTELFWVWRPTKIGQLNKPTTKPRMKDFEAAYHLKDVGCFILPSCALALLADTVEPPLLQALTNNLNYFPETSPQLSSTAWNS
ncbi:unnamed protein product [Caenorhabditis brenneri]